MTELSKYGDSGSSFANQNEVGSMKPIIPTNAAPLCPSTTHPEQEGSVVFGVVGGTVESPRLAYLREPQPVTDELLAVSGSVTPTEFFGLPLLVLVVAVGILMVRIAVLPSGLLVCCQRL
jgi:hypothetical protein